MCVALPVSDVSQTGADKVCSSVSAVVVEVDDLRGLGMAWDRNHNPPLPSWKEETVYPELASVSGRRSEGGEARLLARFCRTATGFEPRLPRYIHTCTYS